MVGENNNTSLQRHKNDSSIFIKFSGHPTWFE